MDQSKISGKANKIMCNDIDVTDESRDEIMKLFVDGENNFLIATDSFEIKFLVKSVLGFTI